MNIGIVGHEAKKFSPEAKARAVQAIEELLAPPDAILVSGACHLGGVDIWAEEVADRLGRAALIHPPATPSWAEGYKPRNLLIARDSDVVHVIVVRDYPESYVGMRFDYCYHCHSREHIKSGACWTARQAIKLGKPAHWHLI